MSPVYGKRDAIGQHHGERGLDWRLDPIRHHALVRHMCHISVRAPGFRPSITVLAVGFVRAPADFYKNAELLPRYFGPPSPESKAEHLPRLFQTSRCRSRLSP